MKSHSKSGTAHAIGQAFLDSFFRKHIVLVQAVGICPIIAVGTNLKYGVALTVCTALVLLPAGLWMPLLNQWSERVRAPIYALGSGLILLIATIVMDRLISPELYAHLYVFIPLMAINTLVAYHTDSSTEHRHPLVTVTGTLAASLGFGVVMCLVAALREMATYGTIWDIPLPMDYTLPEAAYPYAAFIMLAFMAAFLQWLQEAVPRQWRKEGQP